MYFASRVQAGRMLAAQLEKKYRYENCAVVALNNGGVMVGAQIAAALHCVLTMLMTEEIHLPQEPEAIAGISQDGSFSYNEQFAPSEIDEFVMEYRSVIDQERLTKLHNMNQLLGDGGLIRRDLLKGRNIILVADGFPNGFALDIAMEFLKPISIEKIIVAAPLASVHAVDRMHILADEIYCMSVLGDYISTDHYYDQQDVPDQDTVVDTISRVILKWK